MRGGGGGGGTTAHRVRMTLVMIVAVSTATTLRTAEAINRWLYLGTLSVTAPPSRELCASLPGLSQPQRELCRLDPKSILSVRAGIKRGIRECQSQFAYERWNCTTYNASAVGGSVFGNVLLRGTRETAFVYAVTSAAVTHAVTQACSYSGLSTCSCDALVHRLPKNETPAGGGGGAGATPGAAWDWGGCSDNINYGLWFGRAFIDTPERSPRTTTLPPQAAALSATAVATAVAPSRDERWPLHLHNTEAGRKTVERLMTTACRCHGASGSCSVKTCWRALPKFDDVGRQLKDMYERAALVSPSSLSPLPAHASLIAHSQHGGARRLEASADQAHAQAGAAAAIDYKRLAYAETSPTYCSPDPERGALGVAERRCHRDATGAGSCDVLCCGRGYNTQTVTESSRCRCAFHWCCSVVCSTCETTKDVYTCK